jgi:hypothetical protein
MNGARPNSSDCGLNAKQGLDYIFKLGLFEGCGVEDGARGGDKDKGVALRD